MTRKGKGKTGYEETKEKEGKLFGKEGSLSFLLGIPLHESKRMGKETQDTRVFREENWELEILENISPQRCLQPETYNPSAWSRVTSFGSWYDNNS